MKDAATALLNFGVEVVHKLPDWMVFIVVILLILAVAAVAVVLLLASPGRVLGKIKRGLDIIFSKDKDNGNGGDQAGDAQAADPAPAGDGKAKDGGGDGK